jgi:hypothetical protein
MADANDGGFLRGTKTGGLYGPLVVAGANGQALGGGLTDTELRATPVPVSGPQTDAQARATPQPVAASPETGSVYNGTTALTPKRTFANVAASATDSSVVAAVTSKKIRVLAAVFMAGGTATDLTFNSKPGGAGAAISCQFANGINGGATLPFNPSGWFETVAGEGLTVTTGAGSTTGIQITYVEV